MSSKTTLLAPFLPLTCMKTGLRSRVMNFKVTLAASVSLKVTTACPPAGTKRGAIRSLAILSLPNDATVTVNVLVAVLPLASVDLQVTVVVPTGNVDPDGGVQVTGREPSTVSVADVG